MTPELGGYFGLELPDNGDIFSGAVKFQSGRAALHAVLESARVRRVLLPAYICDSVIQAITDAGAAFEYHSLDDSLYPTGLPSSLPRASAVLYVNYFGLCDANVGPLMQEVSHNQLIIDNAHALLAPPTDSLATIYSPRKFVGVPGGGMLVTSDLEIEVPDREDVGSLARVKHLLIRLAYTAKDGYPEYVDSEASLSDTAPLRMSRLSSRLLAAVDFKAVGEKRQANFAALASRLDKHNTLKWSLEKQATPLRYPLVLDVDVLALKKHLAEKGVYIPTYWRECKTRVKSHVESRLTECCLPIPCDQRYSCEQVTEVAVRVVTALAAG